MDTTPNSQRSNNYGGISSQMSFIPGTPRSPIHTPISPSRPNTPMAIPRSGLASAAPRLPIANSTPNRDLIYPPTPESSDTSNENSQTYQLSNNQSSTEAAATNAFIWGTDVNVQQTINAFKTFLYNFEVDRYIDSDFDVNGYYRKQLLLLHTTGGSVLNIDCSHLSNYPITKLFYKQLVNYPNEIIPAMDSVVNEEYNILTFGQSIELKRSITTRIFGLTDRQTTRMRALDPIHIDTLVAIKGMVTRCSNIIPDLKQAYFTCFVCSHSVDVLIDRGRIEEPTNCPSCHALSTMQLVNNRCLFTDKQMIRIQETPDEIPGGETPLSLAVFAYDELVDSVRPGDRIEITGIFRAVARRLNPHMRTLRSIYKTFIDCIHFKLIDNNYNHLTNNPSNQLSNYLTNQPTNESSSQLSNQRINEIKSFVSTCLAISNENLYDVLVKSFAPSIWQLDDVKRGILCMLVGGNQKSTIDRLIDEGIDNDADREVDREFVNQVIGRVDSKVDSKVHQRSEINILLCGDPGTSKSQLLSYVHKLSARGIYTSGKGSSAVGLTASVVRDPDTKEMVLESGALVLSDNGICCIDEFDKMSDMTRAVLHEAMEQQTVSITKAGIIATLNARTAILASANPIDSRYNPSMSVVDNIRLPATLLSRFDLIYLILDQPNSEVDRQLARHMVGLYYSDNDKGSQSSNQSSTQLLSQDFLKDYLAFVRSNYAPSFSEPVEDELVRGYLEMRSLGSKTGTSKTITATTRQLESLIRISQALAKMRLSTDVTIWDVREAIRLMKVATQTAATDPRTGLIDMNMISTGRSNLSIDLSNYLSNQLTLYLSNHKNEKLSLNQIRKEISPHLNTASFTVLDIEEALRGLENEGIIQFLANNTMVFVR